MSQTKLLFFAVCGWGMVFIFIIQIRKAIRTGQFNIDQWGGTHIISRSTHPNEFPMWIYFFCGITFAFAVLDVLCMLAAFGVIKSL